ncbi:MAG: ABC transporter ATP-binding protein [Chloroflexi bacterium]|nr:ABC transporter ATP-binding protein [Chloroflexota bacterium]
MSSPIIELKHVYRSFKSGREIVPVLQDINIAVKRLEFLCLVGESGCGKTTTGKIICGLLPPSAGVVDFEGAEIASLRGENYRRFRRSVQIIHQDPYASLNPTQTVSEMLSYPLRRHKLAPNRRGVLQRVRELLDLVDLTPVEDFIDKYPHQLSGGQRQRVSIARALTTEPSVIVADECVSMVDVSIRIGLLQMMMDLRARLDVTIVFITHDLALAKYFAWDGRIGVMYLGRLVEIGPTQEIIRNPQHPYTKVLLSAIPEPDPEKTRSKQHIQLRSEDIPRLTELPPGCSFHPRCPWYVRDICDRETPELSIPLNAVNDVEVACLPLQQGRELELHDA